jgi:hypothetical protein
MILSSQRKSVGTRSRGWLLFCSEAIQRQGLGVDGGRVVPWRSIGKGEEVKVAKG